MTQVISAGDVDAEALIEELKEWVRIETPSGNPAAVNRLVDRVEAIAEKAGLSI